MKEKQARGSSILQAALHIFAAKGLQEATMEEIAEAAELGKGTIYYYFNSKESLIEELLCAIADRYFQGLLDGTTGMTEPTFIAESVITHMLESYRQQPELFQVMQMILAAPDGGPPRSRQVFSIKHREWLSRLEAETTQVTATHGLDVRTFVDFVGTYAHGLVFAAIAGRNVDKLQEEAKRVFRALLKQPSRKLGGD